MNASSHGDAHGMEKRVNDNRKVGFPCELRQVVLGVSSSRGQQACLAGGYSFLSLVDEELPQLFGEEIERRSIKALSSFGVGFSNANFPNVA